MEGAKRRPKVRVPAKAGIWSIISALVARGVGAVGTPIFTRLLTPEEYGLYPLYTTWLGVFTSLITLGLAGGAIYRGFQRYEGRSEEFLSAALGLFFTAFGVMGGAVILFGEPIAALTGLPTYLSYLMLTEILFSTVIAFMLAEKRYRYKYKSGAFINLISALGTPTVAVLIVKFTPYHAEARIIGALLLSVVIAVPLLFKMMKGGRALYNGEIWRYLLSVSLPLLPHLVSSSLILRASEMVIARVHGREALGKYSVAISVGLALTVLTNGLGQVFSPWILRKIRSGELPLIRRYVGLGAKGLMLSCLLLLSVAPELIALITPPAYHDALPAVYPLTLTTVAMFISGAAMSGEMYYEKNARASLPTILVAGVSVLAAVSILPRLDYRAAGLFALGSYVLLALLNSLGFRRLSGERLIGTGECVGIFSLGLVYAALLYLLRGVFLSRILLAVAILPVLFNTGRQIWQGVRE